MSRATQRRILVTGAAGGIGAAVVRLAVSRGDEVLGIDRDAAALSALAAQLGPTAFSSHVADVSSAAEIAAAVEQLAGTGGIDGLVNAAGVISRHRARDLDIAEWDRVISINLRAPFVVTKCCLPHMSRGGAIVNITSVQATIADGDLPHYAATKGGLSQLTKALAVDLAKDGIRVVAIAPGTTATPLNESRRKDPAIYARYVSRIPLGRLIEPEEIASAVDFAMSPAARSLTGSTIVLDGGLLATR